MKYEVSQCRDGSHQGITHEEHLGEEKETSLTTTLEQRHTSREEGRGGKGSSSISWQIFYSKLYRQQKSQQFECRLSSKKYSSKEAGTSQVGNQLTNFSQVEPRA